jgi:chemotaxis protein CheX
MDEVPVGQDQIRQVCVDVWRKMLWIQLDAGLRPPARSGPNAVASVQFDGSWSGCLTIACPYALAASLGATMYASSEKLLRDQVSDAFGELANIVGSSVKSLLPGETTITVPVVTVGADAVTAIPGSWLATETAFGCLGQPLTVSLFTTGSTPVQQTGSSSRAGTPSGAVVRIS